METVALLLDQPLSKLSFLKMKQYPNIILMIYIGCDIKKNATSSKQNL